MFIVLEQCVQDLDIICHHHFVPCVMFQTNK